MIIVEKQGKVKNNTHNNRFVLEKCELHIRSNMFHIPPNPPNFILIIMYLSLFMSKKLENRVAVITGATSGMALATAKLFVEEGAYVFITGRRQEMLDKAVKEIGKNVTGVQGDAGKIADLDRLFAIVKNEKGRIDVLFASAGYGDSVSHLAPLLRRASTIRSMSMFAGLCLLCKRLCRL